MHSLSELALQIEREWNLLVDNPDANMKDKHGSKKCDRPAERSIRRILSCQVEFDLFITDWHDEAYYFQSQGKNKLELKRGDVLLGFLATAPAKVDVEIVGIGNVILEFEKASLALGTSFIPCWYSCPFQEFNIKSPHSEQIKIVYVTLSSDKRRSWIIDHPQISVYLPSINLKKRNIIDRFINGNYINFAPVKCWSSKSPRYKLMPSLGTLNLMGMISKKKAWLENSGIKEELMARAFSPERIFQVCDDVSRIQDWMKLCSP